MKIQIWCVTPHPTFSTVWPTTLREAECEGNAELVFDGEKVSFFLLTTLHVFSLQPSRGQNEKPRVKREAQAFASGCTLCAPREDSLLLVICSPFLMGNRSPS